MRGRGAAPAGEPAGPGGPSMAPDAAGGPRGRGEPPRPLGSLVRRAPKRLLPDLLSVALVYAVVLVGTWLYSRRILDESPRFPGAGEALPLLLLGVLPLALLAFFALRIRRLLGDLAERRYGSRLRIRLSLLFLAVALAASLPQALFLTRLAGLSQATAVAKATRAGLDGGMDLVLGYYGEDSRRLAYIAQNDLPQAARGRLPKQASRVLADLAAREPRLEALEWFPNSGESVLAGPSAARLGFRPTPSARGALPSASSGGVGRLRFAVPAEGGVAVLTLRLPEGFDRSLGELAEAIRGAELLVPFTASYRRFLALVLAFLVLPLVLLAGILGLQAADLVAEPLVGLEEAMRRVARGDFRVRLLAKPGDETAQLIASFNRMLGEIERYRSDELRKEKIDAWRDIAQRLAHELKNPLTPIRLAAERLLRVKRNDPARALEILEDCMLAVVTEVEGMDALLQDFRSFASLPEPQKDWAELGPLVEDAVALYRASYPGVDFDLERLPRGLTLRVDRAMFKRALGNLVANAVDAMDGRGKVSIGADLVKSSASRYCRIRVSDTGKGIPASIGDRVFSPYFTTKTTGTGLGLSIVERIVADHGGAIRFESAEGFGTSFYIDLPAERQEQSG